MRSDPGKTQSATLPEGSGSGKKNSASALEVEKVPYVFYVHQNVHLSLVLEEEKNNKRIKTIYCREINHLFRLFQDRFWYIFHIYSSN